MTFGHAVTSVISWCAAMALFFFIDWRLGVAMILFSMAFNLEIALVADDVRHELGRQIEHITGA